MEENNMNGQGEPQGEQGDAHMSTPGSGGGSRKALWIIVALIILAALIWLGLALRTDTEPAPESTDDTTSEISEDLNILEEDTSVDLDSEFQAVDEDIEQL